MSGLSASLLATRAACATRVHGSQTYRRHYRGARWRYRHRLGRRRASIGSRAHFPGRCWRVCCCRRNTSRRACTTGTRLQPSRINHSRGRLRTDRVGVHHRRASSYRRTAVSFYRGDHRGRNLRELGSRCCGCRTETAITPRTARGDTRSLRVFLCMSRTVSRVPRPPSFGPGFAVTAIVVGDVSTAWAHAVWTLALCSFAVAIALTVAMPAHAIAVATGLVGPIVLFSYAVPVPAWLRLAAACILAAGFLWAYVGGPVTRAIRKR